MCRSSRIMTATSIAFTILLTVKVLADRAKLWFLSPMFFTPRQGLAVDPKSAAAAESS